jgi:hypothetical protein
MRSSPFLIAVVIAFAGLPRALAQVQFGRTDVETIFFIDKSDDRNRVDYGIRLDRACRPVSSSPMVVYWREFEGGRGGRVTHGIAFYEEPGYGIGRLAVLEQTADGARLSVELRALSSRPVTLVTRREGERCTAVAELAIAGVRARLERVHLTLSGGPTFVDHVDLFGRAIEGDRAVRERIDRR